MKNISFKNITINCFVSIIIVFLTTISFSNILNPLTQKDLIILSLIIIFPMLFFIQGIICSLKKVNMLLALIISLITYLLVTIIFLNSSALIYAPIYSTLEFIGYFIANISIHVKERN